MKTKEKTLLFFFAVIGTLFGYLCVAQDPVFWVKALFILTLCGAFFLVSSLILQELKGIDKRALKPFVLFGLVLVVLANYLFGYRVFVEGDGIRSVLSAPILWLLGIAGIGYLVLRFFNSRR